MAEIDVSSYPTKADPNRFLSGIGEAANVANAVQNNRLLKIQEAQRNVELEKATKDFTTNQATQAYSAFGPLLEGKDPVTHGALTKRVAELIGMRIITPTVGTSILAEIPTDPKAAREWAMSRYGTTFGPEAASTPTAVGMSPDGQPIMGTRLGFLRRAAGAGVTPEAPSAPGAAIAPPGPRAAPGGPVAVEPPRGVISTLPPGEAEAMAVAGQASAEVVSRDRAKARTFTEDMFPLQSALPLVDKLGTKGVGPGSDTWNTVRSALLTWGVPGNVLDTADKTQNFDELKKYLQQNVNRNGDLSTNDKLVASVSGSPNTNMSSAALSDLIKAEIAQRRLKQAQIIAFDNSGEKESGYTKWANRWNTDQDLRAYAMDMMPEEARAKLIESLKGKDREKFIRSLQAAVNAGIIADPRSR